MKKGFYWRLAVTGISKNRQMYLPYILTCTGMVMMYYIVAFLSSYEGVAAMPGGSSMQMMLSMGCGVIGVFSLIFLFYTNSFLIRRRKKEFGLYNILGMGKGNLARILIWESVIVAVISLAGGLICGILFSKLAELCMANMLGGDISPVFAVDPQVVTQTLLLFAVIYLLILLNALRQIHLSNPVDLLRSDRVGEKPPKANWILALLGTLILAAAYYLALTIEDPVSALIWFFVAVVMVIIATYLLFVAGSVALCRLLQKNKRYYYQTNHLISVSSMAYRMKRNGAGLASICILSTMVLVMLSSTACLYLGTENSLRSRYPRNIVVDTYSMEEAHADAVHAAVDGVLAKEGEQAENLLHYRYLDVSGILNGDRVTFDESALTGWDLAGVCQMFIVPLEDYNRLMGTSETLEPDQVLLYSTKSEYSHDTITLEGIGSWRVKEHLSSFENNGVDSMQIFSSLFLFVPDIEVMEGYFDAMAESYGDTRAYKHDYLGFDLACDDEKQTAIQQEITRAVEQLTSDGNEFPMVSIEGVARERAGFYALYGGLFFLGILLGIVFIIGAVLIMYYKQITEGYEDQDRFDILQKVGMTKKEIRRSINSQVLTVFFLPLLMAGLHVAFAFPLISKLLVLFNLTDTLLLIGITAGSFLLFALFYVVVYRVTSRAYFRIVSGAKEG